jgi:hypothetical protein
MNIYRCRWREIDGESELKEIVGDMLNSLRYYWISARGYRLRPWKSPYLIWRFETYLGTRAGEMTAEEFFRLAWKHRAGMRRFANWAAERRRAQRRGSGIA